MWHGPGYQNWGSEFLILITVETLINILSQTTEELKNIIWFSRLVHYSNSTHVLYTSIY